MSEAVLDASAMLALVNGEAGSERVAPMIPRAIMSTVNMAEVVGKLADARLPGDAIRSVIVGLGIRIVPFDDAQAFAVGMLRSRLDRSGLSLADLCCLTLAAKLGAPAVTADKAWQDVDAGVEIVTTR